MLILLRKSSFVFVLFIISVVANEELYCHAKGDECATRNSDKLKDEKGTYV